jgi:hypothetical protein
MSETGLEVFRVIESGHSSNVDSVINTYLDVVCISADAEDLMSSTSSSAAQRLASIRQQQRQAAVGDLLYAHASSRLLRAGIPMCQPGRKPKGGPAIAAPGRQRHVEALLQLHSPGVRAVVTEHARNAIDGSESDVADLLPPDAVLAVSLLQLLKMYVGSMRLGYLLRGVEVRMKLDLGLDAVKTPLSDWTVFRLLKRDNSVVELAQMSQTAGPAAAFAIYMNCIDTPLLVASLTAMPAVCSTVMQRHVAALFQVSDVDLLAKQFDRLLWPDAASAGGIAAASQQAVQRGITAGTLDSVSTTVGTMRYLCVEAVTLGALLHSSVVFCAARYPQALRHDGV